MKKEWQRYFLIGEPDSELEFNAIIRLIKAYEGFGEWQVIVDISNGDRPGRALVERNDKLPRLPAGFEEASQRQLIQAAMADIESMTDEQLNHIENNKIGVKAKQLDVRWHLLPEGVE